jgi:GH15 family glucan-1,4-alpha-glucosidase
LGKRIVLLYYTQKKHCLDKKSTVTTNRGDNKMAEGEGKFYEQAEEAAQTPAQDTWGEVGQQFAHLGESIAAAFNSALKDETTQGFMQQMRVGLEKMAGAIAGAVDNAAHSPEGQKFRQEAEKAVASAATTGKQTMENVRPQLLSALEQLNIKIREMLDRMGQAQPKTPPAPEPTPEPEAKDTPTDELTDPMQVW